MSRHITHPVIMKIHPSCEEIDVLITHLQVLGVKFEGQKKKKKSPNPAQVLFVQDHKVERRERVVILAD